MPSVHALAENREISHLPEPLLRSLGELKQEVIQFLKGKESVADVLLSALLASGHVLFEDVPGVGKTTLIKAIAKWLGLNMARIQCTSDLLPSDIIGVEVFSPSTESFVFHPGPIFSHIVLVDELNRASPRTQSALLEGMAEGVVSINRKSHPLPHPFTVFATQNPSDYVGTYPLPESQLDRFAARIKLHYPSEEREREIFAAAISNPLESVRERVLGLEALQELQAFVDRILVSDRVVRYAKRIVDATRSHEGLRLGISTRGGVIWLRMARARAILHGRNYVIPDDLLYLSEPCLCHRVIARAGGDPHPVLSEILNKTDVD